MSTGFGVVVTQVQLLQVWVFAEVRGQISLTVHRSRADFLNYFQGLPSTTFFTEKKKEKTTLRPECVQNAQFHFRIGGLWISNSWTFFLSHKKKSNIPQMPLLLMGRWLYMETRNIQATFKNLLFGLKHKTTKGRVYPFRISSDHTFVSVTLAPVTKS